VSDSGPGGLPGEDDRAASSDRSSEPGPSRPGGRGSPRDRRPGESRGQRRARDRGAGDDAAPAGRPADGDAAAGPGGSADGAGSSDTSGAAVSRTPFTQQVGRIVLILLAVLFGVFAVANSQVVDFSWVFGETIVRSDAAGETTGGVPLIVLLVVSLVVGIVLGMLMEWLLLRRRRDPQDG
jgi:uncharacterized integral membrane protein